MPLAQKQNDISLSWLRTDNSIKVAGLSWFYGPPLSEMMRLCKRFSHMSKMSNLTYKILTTKHINSYLRYIQWTYKVP